MKIKTLISEDKIENQQSKYFTQPTQKNNHITRHYNFILSFLNIRLKYDKSKEETKTIASRISWYEL